VSSPEGWKAEDAVRGTEGRVYVFEYDDVWEGKGYKEKEVSVYFKWMQGRLVFLTAKTRYGSSFKRRSEK